jgi:hypothetical protein
MSVLSVQNIQETFVGKNISRAATQVTNPNASGYIADGEVVVVNSAGVVYDASSMSNITSPFIQVVQRNGDNLVWSSKINYNKLTAYRGKAFTFGQEQIYHIGYTGSGSNVLDITAGLDFQLTLIENQDDMVWSTQKKKNVTSVPNNLVTSQQDLAKAIVKNVMKKYTIDGISITAAMLNSGTAATIGAITANVTHGSNVVVYSNTATGVAAGSVVRLGATGSAIGTTVPVYTVQGAHPTIPFAWILDQPYAGPSNTTLPNADHGLVTTGASWGVRFTGKALPFRRDFFKFKRTSFTLQMSGFGSTVITKSQEMGYGNGDGRLVLEEESFSKGFEGALNRMTVPLPLANETFTADGSVSNTVGATAAATISVGSAYVTTGAFATFTTAAAHNFVVGQSVTIAGVTTPAVGNPVTAQVVAVPSATTFTIASTVAAASGVTVGAGTATPVYTQNNGDIFPTSAVNYSTLTLEFYSQDQATVVAVSTMPQLVKIMIPAGANQGIATNTGVQTALNDWTGTTVTVM